MFNLFKLFKEEIPVETKTDFLKKEYETALSILLDVKYNHTLGLGETVEHHHQLCLAIHEGLKLGCFAKGDTRHLYLIGRRDDFINRETDRLLKNVGDF